MLTKNRHKAKAQHVSGVTTIGFRSALTRLKLAIISCMLLKLEKLLLQEQLSKGLVPHDNSIKQLGPRHLTRY